MKPVTVTLTAPGTSQWIKLDTYANPFNVGFGVAVSGTGTYDVEHTFDDVDATGSPVVFDHPDFIAQAANKDGNYAFPVRAVRLNASAVAGSVTLTLIQAGG